MKKRLAAAVISAALTLTNVGGMLGTVYAVSYGEEVDFSVKGIDMAEAIMDRIQDLDGDSESVTEEELGFSKGQTEKYNRMFLEEEGTLYEFYPYIEEQDPERDIRTFIRLPEEADETYELTGEEELLFLYMNGSDTTLRFSTVIEHENGKNQKTKRTTVRSYEEVFGVEEEQPESESQEPYDSEEKSTPAEADEREESAVSDSETEDEMESRPILPATPSESLADPVASPPQIQNHGSEVMRPSYDVIGIDGYITAKAYVTSVKELKLLDDWKAANESVFDIADLMEPNYPVLTILDAEGNEIETVEVTEDEVIRIYQAQKDEEGNYLPLPREIKTGFELNYGMEYSEDEELKNHPVAKGDSFTYQLPEGIIYEKKEDVPVYFGSNQVGAMSISGDGQIDIEMTQNVGANFKGSLNVKGSVDFSKEEEGKPEITIQVGEVDKTLVFPELPKEEKKNISITKTYDKVKDLIISEKTGLVEAVRYHLTVTADKENTGDLTNIVITDQYSGTQEGNLVYGDVVTLESVSDGNLITRAEFGNTNLDSSRTIRFYDADGKEGVLRPGDQVTVSYLLQIEPEAWYAEKPKTEDEGKKASSYIRVQFENNATVTAEDGKVTASAKSTFGMSKKLVSKSGVVHRDETIGGQVVPFCIEYNVFVNPELLNMAGWTVRDTLPETKNPKQQQHYVGEVVVRAYDGVGGSLVKEERLPVTDGSLSWEYKILDKFAHNYLQFTYYTNIESPDGSNSENTIQMIAPEGSGFPGTSGSTHIQHTYNTYKLTKETTGWEDDQMGIIGWRAVLSKYVNGVENAEDATIPAGATFSDTLSIDNDKSNTLNHTFKNQEIFKEELVIKDKNGDAVTGFEIKEFSENTFTIRLTKPALSPVTIEYRSYVTNVTDKNGSQDHFEWSYNYTVGFENNAVFKPEGTAMEQADALLKMSTAEGFLKKSVQGTDPEKGTIKWMFECNVGGYKMNLNQVGNIAIKDTLPEGLELVSIYSTAHPNLVLRKGEDYTVDGNTVMLNVSRAAEYIRTSGKNFNLAGSFYFILETRVSDPTKKEFTNHAEMMIQGIKLPEVSAAVSLDASFLSKDMAYDSSTAPFAEYTLLVNQPGTALRTDEGTLTVTDTLGDNMVFRPGSVQVKNSQTGEAIQAEAAITGQTCTISGLPDATPITITYEVMFNGPIGSNFEANNHAELIYGVGSSVGTEHNEFVKLVKPAASVEGDYFIQLSKTDQWGQPLSGAEFTLYELEKGSDGNFTALSDPIEFYEPVFNEEFGTTSVIVDGLKSGKAYRLVETKVPEGYTNGKTVDLYIPTGNEENLPKGEDMFYLYNPGHPVIVANQKQTGTLELTKRVEGQDLETEESAVFYFTVSDGKRYFDEDGTMSTEKQVIALSYDPDGIKSVTVNNLPFGEYTITEVENANGDPISDSFGYEVTVDGEAGISGEVTIEAGKTTEIVFVNTVKEEPGEPEPGEPDPNEPETEPSEPETEPNGPETEPGEPETEPSEPETEPSEPETEPSEPETEPSQPETEAPVIPDGGDADEDAEDDDSPITEVPDEDVPLGSYDGDGSDALVTIPDENVPLAAHAGGDASVLILDEDVPLAALPKMGDTGVLSYVLRMLLALLTGSGAVYLKKRLKRS